MATKRILMFEDSPREWYDLKEHLEELGWEVELTAAAGIVERLGRERFDLILLDIIIFPTTPVDDGEPIVNVQFPDVKPAETGIEFLRRLRRGDFASTQGEGTPRDVPVIAFSAWASDIVKRELRLQLDVKEHFGKPFRLQELVASVQKLLGG